MEEQLCHIYYVCGPSSVLALYKADVHVKKVPITDGQPQTNRNKKKKHLNNVLFRLFSESSVSLKVAFRYSRIWPL